MKYNLDTDKLVSILKGAAIAGAGAAGVYFFSNLADMDFGAFTPAVVALASVVVNALRKYVSEE